MELENLFNDNENVNDTQTEDFEGGENAGAAENGAGQNPDASEKGAADNSGEKVQNAETNRMYAAARRKAEQELQAYRAQVDGFYRKNGYEGFDDYRQKYEQEQNRRAMEEDPNHLGFVGRDIDPMVRAIVSQMPEFKAAREIAEENLKTQQQMEFEKQLNKISELDPTIKTAEDLNGMENAEEFNKLVFENGLSLVDAFRFVNMDRLLQQNEAKTRQDTLNKVNSKSHLSPVSGAPGEEFKVPDEVANEYRIYFPGITDEEIAKHYKENHDS